ncbi:spore germination protein [Priestia aryabhattai]|nr:spore germination protein [Priestia aryabhattai]
MLNSTFQRDTEYVVKTFLELAGDSSDIASKKLWISSTDFFYILYLQGLVDSEKLNQLTEKMVQSKTSSPINTLDRWDSFISTIESTEIYTYKQALTSFFKGEPLLFIHNRTTAYSLNMTMAKQRTWSEPTTEKVVRGPKVALIENLEENIGILRQRASDANLIVEDVFIGEEQLHRTSMVFHKKQCQPHIVNQVREKLQHINLNNVQDSGMIEEFLEEAPYSPFPQVQNTERPDRVLAAINEGRVAIFVDGSPFALLVPTTIDMIMKSPDDYYERWLAGSLLRLLRYISIFITLFFSAIYISLVSFHQGLLPTELAITIAATREDVPFSPFIEAMVMEVTIELLREAGLRLPTPVGQTVGLVGGVVIGQAAVEAHIVSSVMIIIVSVTAIASFTVPQYGIGLSFRILRFGSMIIAAFLGLYGVTLFLLILVTHLTKLESFGMEYFKPFYAKNSKSWKDSYVRLPFKKANVTKR